MKSIEAREDAISITFNSFSRLLDYEEALSPIFFNFYALIWFKKASGNYFLDFKEYDIKENSIIIVSKNQNISFEVFDNRNEFVAITFPQSYIETSDKETQALLSFCIREHFEGKQILKVSPEDENYLESITEHLHKVSEEWQGEVKEKTMFYLLQLLLVYCNELSKSQSFGEVNGYTQIVGDFTTMLEANFKKIQKVNFYTANLNLTYNSLARYTTNYCNKTPKEIITERLILEIKRLLARHKMPIKEISYQLGFDEPTNLVKFFKKYTGITPSEFRREK